MGTEKEYKYEFKDKQGNSMMYLHVVSEDGGNTGRVELHFAARKDPKEYAAAITECKNLARMLRLQCTVEA